MSERVTLKTIATALGVTTTTVHRALNGKDGISEETRAEVRRVAESMGYRVNYMAAALKRKVIRIAVVLPEPVGDSRYYYSGMWMGVRRFLGEAADFNVVPLEYSYRFVYGGNGNALKSLCEVHADKLDGVLTMGVDQGHSSYYINKLRELKVPIVLLGSDMYKDARFCCVRACDEMAGSLAAELLTSFGGKEPKKVIVAGHFGQLGMTDQLRNVSGFENCLKEVAPNVVPVQVRNEDPAAWARDMERVLEREGDIRAVYSCSARYTVYLAEFLKRNGLSGKLTAIGSDLFAESVRFLQEGTLSAIIDKKISRQSYLAAKTLFDYAVKGDMPRSDVLMVRPEVLLRNSVSHMEQSDPGSVFDDII